MFRNYLIAAVRNLCHNRAYAAINVFGLVLGFAAATVIALYVRDEYSFDRFWPEHQRLFKVDGTIAFPGRPILVGSQTFADVAQNLKLDFPQIEATARMDGSTINSLRRDEIEGQPDRSYWVDPNFFTFFPAKTIAGDLASALSVPDGIVLTQKTARRFFGRDDVAGQTIELNRKHVMRVTAVIENWPSNTHLAGDVFLPAMASFSNLTEQDSLTWENGRTKSFSIYTYVRLKPGAAVADVNAELPAFLKRRYATNLLGVSLAEAMTLKLSPVADAHLGVHQMDAMKPQGDVRTLQAMTGIAVLILIVAGGNFVSMMTARAARRAVEVGVRKSVGALRWQVITQFMGECLVYALLAMAVSIVAVELVLPAFNRFLQRGIAFDYVNDLVLGLTIIGVMLATAFLAGLYPSLTISRFRPSVVLKGGPFLTGGRTRLRQAVVVLQFGTLIALIVGTMTIYRQTSYAIRDRLNLPTEQIYISHGGCTPAFADAARQLLGVRGASCVSSPAMAQSHFGGQFSLPTGEAVSTDAAPIDYAYFDMFAVKPIAGRLLSQDYGNDGAAQAVSEASINPSIVINETAARALGFPHAEDAVGQFRNWVRPRRVDGKYAMSNMAPSEIVGVVPDFSLGTVRDFIEPIVYYIDPAFSWSLVLKLDGHDLPTTLLAVRDLWTKQGPARSFDGMFLSQHFDDLYADVLQQSVIFSVFSGIAVAIAALGLLGLAIFTAERRTKEIGLRKAMGASHGDILKILAWQFGKPVLWGSFIAWPAAYFIMQRWLDGFIYHVSLSPWTFLGATALALVIALATVTAHTMLVARAQPVDALRYE